MEEQKELSCPWCKTLNSSDSIYSAGAKRCFKCRKWFEWQENKVVSFNTWKIIQEQERKRKWLT